MTKVNYILISIIIVLLIVGCCFIYWQNGGFEKSYWAVYLDSGDLYFGKLSEFPQLSLTDVWFLQSNAGNEENPFSVEKLTNVFWGPQDKLYLNQENVIWRVELKDDSQIVQFIKSNQNKEVNETTPQNVQEETTDKGQEESPEEESPELNK